MKLQTSTVTVLASVILTNQTVLAAASETTASVTTTSITATSAVDDQKNSTIAATTFQNSKYHTKTPDIQHTHLNQTLSNSTTATLHHPHNHSNITHSTTTSHNRTHHNSNSSSKVNSLFSSVSSSTLGPWKNVSKNMGQSVIDMASGKIITICVSVAGVVAVLGAL